MMTTLDFVTTFNGKFTGGHNSSEHLIWEEQSWLNLTLILGSSFSLVGLVFTFITYR